jgi:hypothetical protein
MEKEKNNRRKTTEEKGGGRETILFPHRRWRKNLTNEDGKALLLRGKEESLSLKERENVAFFFLFLFLFYGERVNTSMY